MTKQEITKLIFVIKATYPKYFATFSKSDYENHDYGLADGTGRLSVFPGIRRT